MIHRERIMRKESAGSWARRRMEPETRFRTGKWGTQRTKEAKFKQGVYSACTFYRDERNIRAVMHGDDFTVLGKSADRGWFRKVIEKKMVVKYKERLVRGNRGSTGAEQRSQFDEGMDRV